MDAADFLARLCGALEEAGVPYMLTGSFASALHGLPRATQDIDLVVDPSPASLGALLQAFPQDAYYVSSDAALDALRRRRQFNIVDFETGWKADLIIRKARPFSVEEFGRRRRARVLGIETFVVSPEDVIVAKLEWAHRGGGSERQLGDVRGVLGAMGDSLDVAYIERWVGELGLSEPWGAVRGGSSDG